MTVGGPILIWPILLILHILSCLCIGCCCCCCNSKVPKRKPTTRKVIKLVLAIFCFGLICISIAGISIAPRFSKSLSKVECSLFESFDTFVNGATSWSGLSGLQS